MLIQLKHIATIENTTYLYSFENKTLLPVNCCYSDEKSIDLMLRIIKGLNAKIQLIKVYKYLDSTFYTYITLVQKNSKYDISCPLEIALKIFQIENCSLYITKNVLFECGIKITKKIIEDALNH